MKILEIIPDLRDGGAQRFVVDLCNELTNQKDIEVILISFYEISENYIFVSELNRNIKTFQLDKKPGFDFKVLVGLSKIIRKVKPDIIHSHLSTIKYILPFIVFSRNKFFHTIHTNPKKEPIDKLTRFLLKKLYNYEKIVPITISNDSSESFISVYKNRNNIEIFNGRPLIEKTNKFHEIKDKIKGYKKTPNTKVFIHIARISKEKNQILLINVFNKLINEGKDIILIMLGSFNDVALYNKINTIKSENIYLLGPVSNPVDYLSCSDAFCLTSFYEGMPITLIEAFQTGCIPVCTPSGGVKNMISHRVNGILAEDISEKTFEKAVIEFLLLSKEKVERMKENCLSTFWEYYYIKNTASEYLKLFTNSPA